MGGVALPAIPPTQMNPRYGCTLRLMSKYHRTTEAIKRARHARQRVVLPAQCWRCGGVIAEGQMFHMGHTVDVANGGAGSPLMPEHIRCNLHEGGRLGAKVTNARKARRDGKAMPSW